VKYISQRSDSAFDLTEYERYLEREGSILAELIEGADLLRR